ncbi:MAG: response regulator [Candidatus Omnitrophica bacterium]|nr:response regulator [Candidatus Omnitrophota bacterium]
MTKKRILLIDDERDLCLVMKLNLERTGTYDVAVAYSGPEGLERAEAELFDLIITDFNMPGMDGGVVLRSLKAMRPQAPVVLCSVYHDDVTAITAAVQREADGLINKPIDHAQLLRTIEQALANGTEG